MRGWPITTDPEDGSLRYTALSGEVLRMGVGGVSLPAYEPAKDSYSSPFLNAPHAQKMTVTLSCPGFANETLSFVTQLATGS